MRIIVWNNRRNKKKNNQLSMKKTRKKKPKQGRNKKYYVHNKWKKNLKYPEPKKKRLPLWDPSNPNAIFTPGGDDNDMIHDSRDDIDADLSSNEGEVEETEEAYLRNFMNLQVMMQESKNKHKHKHNQTYMSKRAKKRAKAQKEEVDIFKGVKHSAALRSQKFEYEDPDAWRYRKKPELDYIQQAKKDKEKERIQNAQFDPRAQLQEDWDCEFCSYHNSKENKICGMCYNEGFQLRYEKFMNVVNENNKVNESAENEKNNAQKQNVPRNAENDGKPKWSCGVCTFINTGKDDECVMCGTVDKQREKWLNRKYGITDDEDEEEQDEDKDADGLDFGDLNVKVNVTVGKHKKSEGEEAEAESAGGVGWE